MGLGCQACRAAANSERRWFGRKAPSYHQDIRILSVVACVWCMHRQRHARLMLPSLEICVDSVHSAVAAEAGGATRLELCANLVDGGTTPSVGMLRAILNRVKIPVYCMIRPRGGDFLYSQAEQDVMRLDIEGLRDVGAHGFVFGMLESYGSVDEILLRSMVHLAAPLEVTFHRAIDVSVDPVAAVHACARCGVHRILTSGGAPAALDGVALIRQMVEAAAGRLVIAVGGGVSEDNARDIARRTGADELHGSLRSTRQSEMRFRPTVAIAMGAEKLNEPGTEFELKEVSTERVRAVAGVLLADLAQTGDEDRRRRRTAAST